MQKNIHTDLAMEAREMHRELQGVQEETAERAGIAITRISVETDEAAEKLGKEKGVYITLDAPELISRPLDLFEELSKALSDELKTLLKDLPPDATVLVVGLGNRSITPDSLGPAVADLVYVTRHVTEYLPDALPKPVRSVCAAAPGVLGVTGIETMEVVRGITEHVKPNLILAVDSLASRRAERISTTLQLTDAGISPGSGVGNARKGLNRDTFGVPVIAIGVPLVVYASTISQDTITLLAEETGMHNDEERLKALAERVINERTNTLIVTPKDIDAIVADMARILADGINLALYGASYEEIRMLIA